MFRTAIWTVVTIGCTVATACAQAPLSRAAIEAESAKTGLRLDLEGQPARLEALRAIERKFTRVVDAVPEGTVALSVDVDPGVLERYEALKELPPIESFFEDMLPETVCFPDERQQQLDTVSAPWSGNCLLVITLSGGSQALGTGWLMGPRLVVTAGHCVHAGAGGSFFQSVEVIPGANGPLQPFGAKVVASAELRASSAWTATGSQALDYGAILLDAAFTSGAGSSPDLHPVSVKSDLELSSADVYLSGYPGDKLFGTQWSDDDPVFMVQSERLHYNLDTFGGQSGSAVIDIADQTAVGIHNYGGCPNRCTRITGAVKADLDAWLVESEL